MGAACGSGGTCVALCTRRHPSFLLFDRSCLPARPPLLACTLPLAAPRPDLAAPGPAKLRCRRWCCCARPAAGGSASTPTCTTAARREPGAQGLLDGPRLQLARTVGQQGEPRALARTSAPSRFPPTPHLTPATPPPNDPAGRCACRCWAPGAAARGRAGTPTCRPPSRRAARRRRRRREPRPGGLPLHSAFCLRAPAPPRLRPTPLEPLALPKRIPPSQTISPLQIHPALPSPFYPRKPPNPVAIETLSPSLPKPRRRPRPPPPPPPRG
jgi:hypothetical protein